MATPAMLNFAEHGQLRVITDRGAEYGENTHIVPVLAEELQSLVLDYTVCLIKSADTGAFGLHALLGFEERENLYLEGDQWHASYVPIHVRRQPFMAGLEQTDGDPSKTGNAVVMINTDSKRVQEKHGEALFTDDGQRTPFLDSINELLARLIPGTESTDAFVDWLASNDLLESARIEVTFADGGQQRFDGLYTVSEARLGELDGSELKEAHDKGYLRACYLMLASIGHVPELVRRKNARQGADD